jgi:L-ascorbate metabolism protein UlaG (beta-lactamase superfamily)
MIAVLKVAGTIVLFLVIALALAITVVPRFLDRIYYRGPASDHFDGQRFFNPDGDADTLRPPGGGSRAGFIFRYLTRTDGRPPWPAHVEVAQGKPPARIEGEAMLATWVGHATVLVQTHGLNILTDPQWSDKTGPFRPPFSLGPRRVAAPGIRFEDLPRIDLVLVSHDHWDHLDQPTLEWLWRRDRPRIVTSLGNDAVIRGAGGAVATAVDWGDRVPIRPGIDVVVTRAHHWGTRWSTDRNRALWSGFVVTFPSGGNLFFAGDTGLGDGKWADEAASYGPIRLALLPIGAFRFVPGQMAIGSHMGPVDAVEVYRRLGATRGIPVHWGTYRLSYEQYDTPPRLLAAATACTGQKGFEPVAIGVPTSIAPYAAFTPPPTMSRDALLRCLDTPAVHALR